MTMVRALGCDGKQGDKHFSGCADAMAASTMARSNAFRSSVGGAVMPDLSVRGESGGDSDRVAVLRLDVQALATSWFAINSNAFTNAE